MEPKEQPLLSSLEVKPGFLEKFGLFVFDCFKWDEDTDSVWEYSDKELNEELTSNLYLALIRVCVISVIFIFPIVYIDMYLMNSSPLFHLGAVVVASVLFTAIEIVFLFAISLFSVFVIASVLRINTIKFKHKHVRHDGAFAWKNILVRTALEIDSPEVEILGNPNQNCF